MISCTGIRTNRRDYEKAFSWYLKSAVQGSSEAIAKCWNCVRHIDALGHQDRAMELCLSSPVSEHLNFQRYLACAYFNKGDIDQTLQWSLKIAEHGEVEDLVYVGRLYLSKKRPELAVEFFRRAAASGNGLAHQLLAEMYGFGLGVDKDEVAATRHYKESASQGYVLSQVRLLHLKRKRGGLAATLEFAAMLPFLICKALIIKVRNPNDPRVADIPCG